MNDSYRRLTSLQNDQVKNLVRLRKRRERDQQRVTLIEEPLVISRALAAGYPLSAVYFCPELIAAEDQKLLTDLQTLATLQPELNIVELTEPVMAKVAYRDAPQGILVVAPQRRTCLSDLELSPVPLLIVLESVEKPGNLGAVLRIADGAGADAVIVCGQGTDLFNPNVLRASRGTFFGVPAVACSQTELLAYLTANEIHAIATSPVADSAWDQADLTVPTAILMGTEHEGLSEQMLTRANKVLSIPMSGLGDSLNVATATAILLYEAVRQRQPRD